MKVTPVLSCAALSAILGSGAVDAQAPPAPPSGTADAAPAVLSDAYKDHVAAATAAAKGMARNILNLCAIPAAGAGFGGRGGAPGGGAGGGASNPLPAGGPLEPGKAFDNLYYVGLREVSAWAIKTSAGIILIDTLNNAKDAEETIVPSMKKVGLDPAQIKYVVITHAHGDHYGGAQYLVDHFHPRVISSEADWKAMEGPPPVFANMPRPAPADPARPAPVRAAPPKRDMVITDGEKLTLGDTTITMFLTPGHSPGTISVIMPVKDKGVPHTAALWGGTAFNFVPAVATFKMYAESADHFREATRRAAVDVMLSNHGFVDDTPTKLPALQNRKPGEPNPYVVGAETVHSFLTVAGECARARMEAM